MAPAELKLLVLSPSIKNWPILLALGGLVAFTGLIVMALTTLSVGLTVIATGVGLTVWPALKAANTEYQITNLRVMVQGGLFGRSANELPIKGIREVKVLHNAMQRALGIGDLEFVGDSGSLRLEGVEEPDKVRDKVLSLT